MEADRKTFAYIWDRYPFRVHLATAKDVASVRESVASWHVFRLGSRFKIHVDYTY